MSKDEADTRAQVRSMAKLSILANKISSVQEKNLLMFPQVFFDGVTGGKVDYDFSHASLIDTSEDKDKLELNYKFKGVDSNHFRVSYYLQIPAELQKQDHLDKRFQAIENAVRTLFYSNVKVEVFFNDRKVYESK